MPSPASVRKHPLHPTLVTLPVGLWVFALVCDVARMASGDSAWQVVATYCISGGIVGAVLAAIPGLIDYFSIDEAGMRSIANFHLTANFAAIALFAINLWLRLRLLPSDSVVPPLLSLVGVVAIGVAGWLGGEMVYVKGMGVEAVDKLANKVEKASPRRVA